MTRFACSALLLVAAFCVSSPSLKAQQNNSALSGAPAAKSLAPTDGAAHPPALQQRNPRYQVMRSDVLALVFPLSPEFNRQVTVQPDGYINLQGAGSVYVQGMTVPEIGTALKKAYANILHDPIIDVDLIDFQKPYVVVTGQVGKPGQYDLRHETTVSQAIGIAGGLLGGGKSQALLYHRVSSDWIEVKKLDLKDIFNGKNVNEDAMLQPGDTIYVPEKFITKFRKYLPYSIGTSFNPQMALQ